MKTLNEMTHTEFSRKGGLTMTDRKLEALRANAEKARAARIKLSKHARRMNRARRKASARLGI